VPRKRTRLSISCDGGPKRGSTRKLRGFRPDIDMPRTAFAARDDLVFDNEAGVWCKDLQWGNS
jgi:hypothetical protein